MIVRVVLLSSNISKACGTAGWFVIVRGKFELIALLTNRSNVSFRCGVSSLPALTIKMGVLRGRSHPDNLRNLWMSGI
jgi:hypothetical protein